MLQYGERYFSFAVFSRVLRSVLAVDGVYGSLCSCTSHRWTVYITRPCVFTYKVVAILHDELCFFPCIAALIRENVGGSKQIPSHFWPIGASLCSYRACLCLLWGCSSLSMRTSIFSVRFILCN